MTTQNVAEQLMAYCKAGEFSKAQKELYADHAVSIEPAGSPWPERTEGLEAIFAKEQQFNDMVEEMHGLELTGPIVSDHYFSCTMTLDVTFKGQPRTKNSEVCVYGVKDGKIISEQFFTSPT